MTSRSSIRALCALSAVFVLGACGGDEEEARSPINPDGSLTIDLVEEDDSGQSGQATLYRLSGERTRIVIELDASEGRLPAYVHENACDGPDPTPTDRLEAVVNGQSETVIRVSFQHLRSSPHAIIVYRSVDEYAACGTVGSAEDKLLDA